MKMKHILSARQFDQEDLGEIFELTDYIVEKNKTEEGERELKNRHVGSVAIQFYEPSTRTRQSFELAANAIGLDYSSTENARQFSSAAKGESLEHTIRTLGEYNTKAIVLRYDEEGGADRASKVSRVPIINGGDGKGEHPTQAVLDLYTIQQQKGRLSDLNIVMGGDLKHGRTIRSLSMLLALYPRNSISFVTIPELQMEEDVKSYLTSHGVDFKESADAFTEFREADVIYWTRLQTERLKKPEVDEHDPTPEQIEAHEAHLDMLDRLQRSFRIDEAALDVMKEDAIIMHPMPIGGGEIAETVDDDRRAVYFKQAGNGKPVRMSILDLLVKANR